MAVDDISWWPLLAALLTENEPTVQGKRRAVLEYVLVFRRIERGRT